MKLQAQNPPHIRTRESNLTVMTDVIIAMLPLYAMATYYYGARALLLGGYSVLICTLADLLCTLLAGRVPNIRDLSPAVTGMLVPLLMPASIRLEILAAAGLFAIAVAKHPFGGVGQNIFNPAAAGAAFAIVCWPRSMFAYPVPLEWMPIAVDETIRLGTSPARALALGGAPTIDMLDMLLGNFPGPMGATNILVLLTCLLFLTFRRAVSLGMTVSFVAGAAAVAALFPRADLSPFRSVSYELMSGMLLLGALFLLNDPVTSPRRRPSRLLYGLLAGIVSMIFRHLGRFEESLLFAVLVMNAAVWMIDLLGEHLARAIRRRNSEFKQGKALSALDSDDFGGAED